MMYQKLVVPIDHGNRNMKTEDAIFTSGLVESECEPALGDSLYYAGHYYSLSGQRIPTRLLMSVFSSLPCLRLRWRRTEDIFPMTPFCR